MTPLSRRVLSLAKSSYLLGAGAGAGAATAGAGAAFLDLSGSMSCPFLRTLAPKGARKHLANLNCCKPSGIPMMVRQRSAP